MSEQEEFVLVGVVSRDDANKKGGKHKEFAEIVEGMAKVQPHQALKLTAENANDIARLKAYLKKYYPTYKVSKWKLPTGGFEVRVSLAK